MKRLTRKLSVGGCALALVATGWAFAQNQNSGDTQANSDNPALQVSLSVPSGTTYTRKSVPVRVTFEVFDKSFRVLRLFKPTSEFFDLSLQDIAGDPLPVPKTTPNSRKSPLTPKSLSYFDLSAGETFGTQVDIAELLPPDLKEGRYRVALTYRNQQGENCFKGTRKTDFVSLTIVDEPVAEVAGSISEQKAIDLARQAIAGKIKLKSNDKVTVRNTAKQFIVTFSHPLPAGRFGPDYDAQVRVNRVTGAVEELLAGS